MKKQKIIEFSLKLIVVCVLAITVGASLALTLNYVAELPCVKALSVNNEQEIVVATEKEKLELKELIKIHGPIGWYKEKGLAVRLTGPNKGQVIRIKEK